MTVRIRHFRDSVCYFHGRGPGAGLRPSAAFNTLREASKNYDASEFTAIGL